MRNVSYCPAGGRSSLLAAVLVSVRVLSLPLILQAVSFWSVPAAAQDAPVAPVRVIKDGPGSVAALLGSEARACLADAVTGAACQLLDDDLVSRGDAILLAARAHDCEHWPLSKKNRDRAENGRESQAPRGKGAD